MYKAETDRFGLGATSSPGMQNELYFMVLFIKFPHRYKTPKLTLTISGVVTCNFPFEFVSFLFLRLLIYYFVFSVLTAKHFSQEL